MIPSPITSCPPRRLLIGCGAGYVGSRMAKHLLRRGCDIVMFDNKSTAYRDMAPGCEPLPLVAEKSAGGEAPQWKPTRFDLSNIVDDDVKREEKVASQSGYA